MKLIEPPTHVVKKGKSEMTCTILELASEFMFVESMDPDTVSEIVEKTADYFRNKKRSCVTKRQFRDGLLEVCIKSGLKVTFPQKDVVKPWDAQWSWFAAYLCGYIKI